MCLHRTPYRTTRYVVDVYVHAHFQSRLGEKPKSFMALVSLYVLITKVGQFTELTLFSRDQVTSCIADCCHQRALQYFSADIFNYEAGLDCTSIPASTAQIGAWQTMVDSHFWLQLSSIPSAQLGCSGLAVTPLGVSCGWQGKRH